MRRRADIHVSVVQDKVLDMDELALKPKCRDGVGKILALDPALPNRRTVKPLIETRQNLRGASNRADEPIQRQFAEVINH
ncbi:MAG: hypothetical protein E5Y26_08220 [Mesorhizobium sp.]|nr:MAG: hypothetical protein E5Y26_08220 [Mesorhizobium sp.]